MVQKTLLSFVMDATEMPQHTNKYLYKENRNSQSFERENNIYVYIES